MTNEPKDPFKLDFNEAAKCIRFAWQTNPRLCLASGILSIGYLLQTLMPLLLSGIISSVTTGNAWLAVLFLLIWILANEGNWIVIAVGMVFGNRFRDQLRFAAERRTLKALLAPNTIEHYRDSRLTKIRQRFAECGDLVGQTWSIFFELANSLIFPVGMSIIALWLTPAAWVLLPCCLPGLLLSSKQAQLQRLALEASGPSSSKMDSIIEWLADEHNASHARHIEAVNDIRSRYHHEALQWGLVRSKYGTKAELIGITTHLLYILAAVGLLSYTLLTGAATAATAGTITGLLVIIVMLYGSVFGVQESYIDAAGVSAAVSDILIIEKISSEYEPAQVDFGSYGDIILDRVSYTYPGASCPALEPITLTIPAGATLAIVGNNGAGKTTLVDMLSGACRPTTGTITFGKVAEKSDKNKMADNSTQTFSKQDRTEHTQSDLRKPVNLIEDFAPTHAVTGAFQNGLRIAHSVRTEVSAGRGREGGDMSQIEVCAALEKSGAEDFTTQLSRDLLMNPVSGGQWQKLAVARTQVDAYSWLGLFDEPSSALDAYAERELFSLIMQRSKTSRKSTTVLVSHNLAAGSLADLVAHLDKGKLVCFGTHTELIERDPQYAKAYLAQIDAYQD